MEQYTLSQDHSTAPTLADALTLADAGIPIIPLAKDTKHPPQGFGGWEHRATTLDAIITGWLHEWPGCNLGTVVPPGRLVLDVDARHNGLAGFNNLQARHTALPATWKVWTGGEGHGFHLYYAIPTGVQVPNTLDIDVGVQVLGLEHLVVLPPSIHPDTGNTYTWDDTWNPTTLATPTPAPPWLLEEIRATAARHQKKAGTHTGAHATQKKKAAVQRGGEGSALQKKTAAHSEGSGKHPPPGVRCAEHGEPGVEPPRATPYSPAPHPRAKGHGDRVATLLRDPASVPSLLQALGYPGDLQDGAAVRCLCPSHARGDLHPSGVWREPKGLTKDYGVWCFTARTFYTVNELEHYHDGATTPLRASVDDDGKQHEHRRHFLMLGVRLLQRASLIHLPTAWGYPTLPKGAPEDVQVLYGVILDIKHHRNATERGGQEPLPLAYSFLRAWSASVRHWGNKRLQDAFVWLCSHAVLRKVGSIGAGILKTALWLLGGLAMRKARKDVPEERTIDLAVAAVEATAVPPPVLPSPAYPLVQAHGCDQAHQRDHDFRQCVDCLQVRLLEGRTRKGVVVDEADPYRLKPGHWQHALA